MRLLNNLVIYTLLVAIALVMVFPLVWMAMSSLKPNSTEIVDHPWSLPTTWTLGNFREAWGRAGIGRCMWNSSIITAGTLIGTMAVSSLAAYGLARLVFPGRDKLYYFFLLGLIMPIEAYLIPLYEQFRQVPYMGGGLNDSRLALILIYTGISAPLAIYILRAFMVGLPSSLDESATVDGCGPLGVFFWIVLPLSRPALATIGIFTALGAWNEFLVAVLFIREPLIQPITLGLQSFFGERNTDYHLLIAALTMVVLPMIALYVLFSRQIVAGLTAGAVKE